jgi:hypothetical protein
VFHGLQNLNLLALLPDPQTVVRSALWQQLAHDGLKDEPLNPALHGVGDFAGFRVRVSIFRIYTKGACAAACQAVRAALALVLPVGCSCAVVYMGIRAFWRTENGCTWYYFHVGFVAKQ